MAKRDLSERVAEAVERALQRQKYVSAVDVLMGMGLLAPAHLEGWRRGQTPHLEQVLQGNLSKLSETLKLFRQNAEARGLKPSETVYVTQGRGGERRPLQFSVSGNPEVEKAYRTHYLSPVLSEREQQRLLEKASAPKEIVVYSTLRDSKCGECDEELFQGGFLTLEGGAALCLLCSGLDHLVYLPSGNAALTRRTANYSKLRAVVVRFSRSRGRYERQGILAEPAALERAERECLDDDEQRARQRERGAQRRAAENVRLVERMSQQILALYPGCPMKEATVIAEHTAEPGSGRVGRTAAARAFEENALRRAVVAAIRHRHTNYDELLAKSMDRLRAREKVRDQVEAVLEKWAPGSPKEKL